MGILPRAPSVATVPGHGTIPSRRKGAADILGDEIELYTETGDPIAFAVFRTDQNGKKTRTKQAEARALTTRIESEEDEQR